MSVGKYTVRKIQKSLYSSVDLVVMAGWLHPIPFRTRP